MKLARFTHGAATRWGFVDDEAVRPVPDESPSLTDALSAGPTVLSALRDRAAAPVPLAEVLLRSPVDQPSKVVCVGLNYGEHARESGLTVPAEPMVFAKFPSSISGPFDDIVLPPESAQVDWEAELAIVVGRRAEHVAEGAALDFVGGYLVANDVSARDIQARDGQWVRAKSFTSFCPLGPWVTTRDEVGDASGLNVRLTVNGVVMQDGNTSDLVADVRRIVSFCSQISALEVGDIILTGTPAGTGVGMKPQRFLAEGDHVETSIHGLGSLSNRVVGSGE